jgi:hypothetical protein
MRRPGFEVDERNVSIFHRICARLYVATLALLWLDILYRRIWLGQPFSAVADLSTLAAANVLVAIGAVLYAGGVTIPRFRPATVAVFYLVSVVAGTVAWSAGGDDADSLSIAAKALIVAALGAVLVGAYVIAARLGSRRTERSLEE